MQEPLPEPAQSVAAQPISAWSTIGTLVREALETIVLTFIIFLLIQSVVQNFRIEGFSMEPTLNAGQYLIVNKLIYRLHPPERGDIIVFEYPRAPDRDFIKRVIGLPGDQVQVTGRHVLINGTPLLEPYIKDAPNYEFPPTIVPPTEYFVMGDNRNNSSDSHSWGMLPTPNIIGKAWFSYWPPSHWGLVPNSSSAASN
ncbi:MAG: signal peptidase I [Chloroflexi bacterium]|nr:signal peptidase I [Chloroflexota bacterium]